MDSIIRPRRSTRALDVLESDPPAIDATPDIGQITLACALGYQDLRFQGHGGNLSAPRGLARRFRTARAVLREDEGRSLISNGCE